MQKPGHLKQRIALLDHLRQRNWTARPFHLARQHASQPHHLPAMAVPTAAATAAPPGIHQALAAARHLLEMYRRQKKKPGAGCSGSITGSSPLHPNSIGSLQPKNEERLAGQ
ncbi:MAG: hypothetical protein DMG57_23315 [Acidobacteria bacterium]|nr:MAG: hypothetical protein DMG57_23315 [Acidobacteriota bacterium]